MSFVAAVLKRPYTVVAALILICIMGLGAAQRMPVDIFPEIDIPVVSVVWTYSGMSPRDMQNRILTLHERQLASLVDDISRIESTAYNGVGVLKVYLHQGADVTRAISQLSSSALVILKSMPRNITPPLVLRYGATDVPIIQLSISSPTLPDAKLNDLGQNIIRPDLAVVRGASIPYPYGGMPRVMMVDLDPQALEARGLTPTDVSDALQKQNVILPSGDVKIGDKDYTLAMNNSPDVITAINRYPVKEVDGKMVFIGDVAHVHDGHQVQSNSVAVNGKPGALVMVRKTEGVSTLAVIDGVKEALVDIRKLLPASVMVKPIFDQSVFVKAALNSVVMGGLIAAGLTALMILLFLGNWRLTLIILTTIPLSIVAATVLLYLGGETLNTMTLGGFALAVGILVDNGTVVIENIERHVGLREPLIKAIVDGAGEVGAPTMLSTLCICIVFVPIFLLQGTAKYLFSPLSVSVCLALIASLALSFTLVPILFKYLMGAAVAAHDDEPASSTPGRPPRLNPFSIIHRGFEAGFDGFRDAYRGSVTYAVAHAKSTILFFILLMAFSLALFPDLGRDFFPQVDAGEMRLHVRAPPATRIEETQRYFAEVEKAIRERFGDGRSDGRRDSRFAEKRAYVDPRPYRRPQARTAEAFPDSAILLSAGRHRRSGPEFRPAGADRHPHHRSGQRQIVRARFENRDRHQERARNCRLACRAGAERPGLDHRHGPHARSASGRRSILGGQQRVGDDQFEHADGAEFLGQSRDRLELPADRANAELSHQLGRRPVDSADHVGGRRRDGADADERRPVRAGRRPARDLAAEYPAGLRRQRGRARNRSRRRGRRNREGDRRRRAAGERCDESGAQRPDRDDAGELCRAVLGHGLGGGACLSGAGHQFPELDRPAHRSRRRAFRFGRRHVDAVPLADASQHSGSDGLVDVHRTDDREQHFGRHVRQSACGVGRPSAPGRDCGGLYKAAPGPDDGGRDDHRHDPDGAWRRRGRRAECAAGARRDRRIVVRHVGHLDFRPRNVRALAQAGRRAGGRAGRRRVRTCRGLVKEAERTRG